MSTVAEIVEAVKQLRPEQKRDLLDQLEPALFDSVAGRTGKPYEGYLSADFSRRLAAHFHKAKQAALSQS